MDDPLRVLVVEDHDVAIMGIRSVLDKTADFQCIGTVTDGLEAIEAVKSLSPDIVTMDLSMPRLAGIAAAERILAFDNNIKICILTAHAERAFAVHAFRLGIPGYILKEEPLSKLILAFEAIRDGATFYSEKIVQTINEYLRETRLTADQDIQKKQDGIPILSNREKEVFILLAEGRTPKEIGKRLYISPKTAETHKYNILDKLNFRTTAELTKLAIKKRLIDL